MPKSKAIQFIEEMGLSEEYKKWLKDNKASKDEFDYGEFLSKDLHRTELEPNKFYALIGNKELPAGRTLNDTQNLFLGGSYMSPVWHKGVFREITEEAFNRIREDFNKKLYGK